jgi:hypothetical protein
MSRHAELVDAALARAMTRSRDGNRRPDDVLAVEVVRLRRLVEVRDEALAKARAQIEQLTADLADADARATTGGRIKPYTHGWTAPAHMPPPPSASDPTAPPLGRGLTNPVDLRPTRTAETGEEL